MVPPAATIDVSVYPETDTTTFTIPDRLTIQAIAKRRAASGKLIAGVAAAADLEQYKGRTSHLHKPLAKRWDRTYTLFRLHLTRLLPMDTDRSNRSIEP